MGGDFQFTAIETVQDIQQGIRSRFIDPKAKDVDGSTWLLVAASSQHSEVNTALIKAGADLNARNKNGVGVLMFATYNPNAGRAPLNAYGAADLATSREKVISTLLFGCKRRTAVRSASVNDGARSGGPSLLQSGNEAARGIDREKHRSSLRFHFV